MNGRVPGGIERYSRLQNINGFGTFSTHFINTHVDGSNKLMPMDHSAQKRRSLDHETKGQCNVGHG